MNEKRIGCAHNYLGVCSQCKLASLRVESHQLRTQLAKAIAALNKIASDKKEFCYHTELASTTLAELKGE
jgi:hypothetical protein